VKEKKKKERIKKMGENINEKIKDSCIHQT
jgi:hypothetical protein